MIQDSDVYKFLNPICSLYKAEHGTTKSRLNQWTFSYSLVAENEQLMQVFQQVFSKKDIGEGLELMFEELSERGYINEHPDGSYHLTAAGLEKGTQSASSKFLEFFNINPGINTIIAILSFFLAATALYVSI